MLEIFLYGAATLLSLVGLVEIIRAAALFLISDKDSSNQLLIVLLDDNNAEAALRSALETSKRIGGRSCRHIIAVDTGLSSQSAEICKKFCEDCDALILCSRESLTELISSISSRNKFEY